MTVHSWMCFDKTLVLDKPGHPPLPPPNLWHYQPSYWLQRVQQSPGQVYPLSDWYTPPHPTCTLRQRSPTFLAPGTGFVEDNFSTDLGGGGVAMVQAADEALLACPLLTSCCAAQFLRGQSPGVGDPCSKVLSYMILLNTSQRWLFDLFHLGKPKMTKV